MRAGDLIPHESNPRTHSPAQRRALEMLLQEIGFARSLLAYRQADGRLKLIDGHLRRSLDPEQTVEVEVLDVSDQEARSLLLAIDPLAQLAGYDGDVLQELRATVEKDSEAVRTLWDILRQASSTTQGALEKQADDRLTPRFFVLITCQNETEQKGLLDRFTNEGLTCEAKLG